MVHVALYARVSTEDQARDGFSLSAQLDRLRAYAGIQGWVVAGEYVDDGYSGRNVKRPAYKRMWSEAAAWDTILVMKMDRIHRNSINFMAMMEDVRKLDKRFSSVQDHLDTSTATGRFFVDMLQRLAQMESEQIGERVTIGMTQKAREGQGSLGGTAPFGYTYLAGRLTPHETEAPLLKEIFSRFLAGGPKQAIVSWLNDSNIRGRRGAAWTIHTLDAVLRNPTYAGVRIWNGIATQNAHPALVDAATVQRAQSLLTQGAPKMRIVPINA